MKLLELRLTNFRQFKGEQRLLFAGDPSRNVTLVFGANGSGKTTLLNAFTWALYGTLSSDLEAQGSLVTEDVWRSLPFGAAATVAVEVYFEHGDDVYRVRREVSTTKTGDEQDLPPAQLRLWVTKPDGTCDEVKVAQQRLDGILPEQLSRFFFFNGERIEHLVSKSAYAEVKQAIKTLLGLEHVERALEHLPKVERKLNADLRKHGGERAAEIATRIDETRDRQQAVSAEYEEVERETSRLSEERAEVLRLLAQHESAGPLQNERARVVLALKEARDARATAEAARRRRVAEGGFVAFTEPLAEKVREMADALHRKGELPAPIKRDFVDSLLNDERRCICGTPLDDGTAAREQVTAWRLKAGLAEVEAGWQRLRGDLARLPDERQKLRAELEQMTKQIADHSRRIHELQQEQTELDAKIEKLPLEDVQRLEAKRTDLDDRINAGHRSLGALRERRETLAAEVERLLNDLRKAEIKDELAAKARKRIELVQEVHSALERIHQIRTESVRADLDARIKDVFARITIKPFVPHLTEQFELRLAHRDDQRPVAKSTGENQILSLSFVAAVSQLAQEYRVRSTEGDVLDAGGSFPLVMDAAFGSLDVNYQREVAQALPEMAPQMVVLVSKSQGLGTVFDHLNAHVGRLGVVVAHTTAAERDPEQIELRGHEYPYIRTREDSDCAELLEVPA